MNTTRYKQQQIYYRPRSGNICQLPIPPAYKLAAATSQRHLVAEVYRAANCRRVAIVAASNLLYNVNISTGPAWTTL